MTTKQRAIANGKSTYYSHVKCKLGHGSTRNVETGKCVVCEKKGIRPSYNKENRKTDEYRAYQREYQKEYYQKNKDKLAERQKVYFSKPANFDTFAKQLPPTDKPKKSREGFLKVGCYRCKKPFIPTRQQAANRVQALKGKYTLGDEHNFYCSDKCKDSCVVYRASTKSTDPRSNAHVDQSVIDKVRACQTDHLKQLQCDKHGYNYCEKCGDFVDVHLHHTLPINKHGLAAVSSAGHMLLCHRCHAVVHTGC